MALFTDLKVSQDNNKNIKVTYLDKPFIVIKTKVLAEIVQRYAYKSFIDKLKEVPRVEEPDRKLRITAGKIEDIYTSKKRKHHSDRKRIIKSIQKDTKDYDYILKAAQMCLDLSVTPKEYVDAQIEGLRFTGKYPTIKQLVATQAKDRVLEFVRELTREEVEESIKLTKDDKTLYFLDNKKFMNIYEKIMNEEEVPIEEAVYCSKVVSVFKDKPDNYIEEYIDNWYGVN